MARKYSPIFEGLVNGRYDIIGHIAYSLYKSDKAHYIETFKTLNGREPDEDELHTFHIISAQPDSIEKYRLIGASVLADFVGDTLADSRAKIEDECREKHAEILYGIIAPLLPRSKWAIFWHGVLQSVAGAFIFALIVAAFVFIKTYQGA